MAERKENGYWFTTENGVHIFVKKGQSVEEAVKQRFDDITDDDLGPDENEKSDKFDDDFEIDDEDYISGIKRDLNNAISKEEFENISDAIDKGLEDGLITEETSDRLYDELNKAIDEANKIPDEEDEEDEEESGSEKKLEDYLKDSEMVSYGKELPKGAAYLAENGTYYSSQEGNLTHEELNSSAGTDFFNDHKMIALNPGVFGSRVARIDIPEGKELNRDEENAIENFVDGLEEGKTVDFGAGPYGTNEYTGKDIVYALRRYLRGKK